MIMYSKKEFLLDKTQHHVHIIDMNSENVQIDLSTKRLEIEFPKTYKEHLDRIATHEISNKYCVCHENGYTLVLAYLVDRRFGKNKDSPESINLRFTSFVSTMMEKFGPDAVFVSGRMYKNVIHWKKFKKILNSFNNLNWIIYEE